LTEKLRERYLFIFLECNGILLFDEDLAVVIDMFQAKIRILFMTRNVFDHRCIGNILVANECNEDAYILAQGRSGGGTAYHR
jgi:hypothetical protein